MKQRIPLRFGLIRRPIFPEPTLKLNPNIERKSNQMTKFDYERIAEAEARRERKHLKKEKK